MQTQQQGLLGERSHVSLSRNVGWMLGSTCIVVWGTSKRTWTATAVYIFIIFVDGTRMVMVIVMRDNDHDSYG
jgi:hypothetical protein